MGGSRVLTVLEDSKEQVEELLTAKFDAKRRETAKAVPG